MTFAKINNEITKNNIRHGLCSIIWPGYSAGKNANTYKLVKVDIYHNFKSDSMKSFTVMYISRCRSLVHYRILYF